LNTREFSILYPPPGTDWCSINEWLAYTSLNNKNEKSMFHILINSCKPVGFQVPENNSARNFQSLY